MEEAQAPLDTVVPVGLMGGNRVICPFLVGTVTGRELGVLGLGKGGLGHTDRRALAYRVLAPPTAARCCCHCWVVRVEVPTALAEVEVEVEAQF